MIPISLIGPMSPIRGNHLTVEHAAMFLSRQQFFAKLQQVAQDPESKPATEGRWSHRDAMNKSMKERWTTNDISGFGFAFTLVLLGTILSAYSDRPVFWLLVGPGPLVVGLTVVTFLRYVSRERPEMRFVETRKNRRNYRPRRVKLISSGG
jgi:hypothetical protein